MIIISSQIIQVVHLIFLKKIVFILRQTRSPVTQFAFPRKSQLHKNLKFFFLNPVQILEKNVPRCARKVFINYWKSFVKFSSGQRARLSTCIQICVGLWEFQFCKYWHFSVYCRIGKFSVFMIYFCFDNDNEVKYEYCDWHVNSVFSLSLDSLAPRIGLLW